MFSFSISELEKITEVLESNETESITKEPIYVEEPNSADCVSTTLSDEDLQNLQNNISIQESDVKEIDEDVKQTQKEIPPIYNSLYSSTSPISINSSEVSLDEIHQQNSQVKLENLSRKQKLQEQINNTPNKSLFSKITDKIMSSTENKEKEQENNSPANILGSLSIKFIYPSGKLSGEAFTNLDNIIIEFHQQLINENTKNDNIPIYPMISPTPPKEGTWTCKENQLIYSEFTLNPSEKYLITVPKNFTAPNCLLLPNLYNNTFETPRIYIKNNKYYENKQVSQNQIFWIEPSEFVKENHFLQNLKIKVNGKKFPFSLCTLKEALPSPFIDENNEFSQNSLFIKPNRELPTNSSIEINLPSGYKSTCGSLSTLENIEIIKCTVVPKFKIKHQNHLKFISTHPINDLHSWIPQSTPELDVNYWVLSKDKRTIEYISNQQFKQSSKYEIIFKELHSFYGNQIQLKNFEITLNPIEIDVKINYLSNFELISPEHIFTINFSQLINSNEAIKSISFFNESLSFYSNACLIENHLLESNSIQFKSTIPLEYSKKYHLKIGPSFSSLEGNGITKYENKFLVSVFPPLKFDFKNEFSKISIISSHPIPKDFPIEISPFVNVELVNDDVFFTHFSIQKELFELSTEYTIKIPTTSKTMVKTSLNSPIEFKFKTNTNYTLQIFPNLIVNEFLSTVPLFAIVFTQPVSWNIIKDHIFLSTSSKNIPLLNIPYNELLQTKGNHRKIEVQCRPYSQENIIIVIPECTLQAKQNYSFGLHAIPSTLGPLYGEKTIKTYQTKPDFSLTLFENTEKSFSFTFSAPLANTFEDFLELQNGNDWLPTIEPNIHGVWSLKKKNQLEFNLHVLENVNQFPNSTLFEIQLSQKMVNEDLMSIKKPIRKSFETPRIKILQILPLDRSFIFKKGYIIITFSQQINSLHIKPFLEIYTKSKGKKNIIQYNCIDFNDYLSENYFQLDDLISPNHILIIQPININNSSSLLYVQLNSGFPSEEGPLPSTESCKLKYTIQQKFLCNLQEENNNLSLNFSFPIKINENNQLNENQIPKIQPNIEGNWEIKNSNQIQFHPLELWKKSTSYHITLSSEIKSIYNHSLSSENQKLIYTTSLPIAKINFPYSKDLIRCDQIFYISFDQPIDKNSIHEKINFYFSTGLLKRNKKYSSKLISLDDFLKNNKNNEEFIHLSETENDIFIQCSEIFPNDKKIKIQIDKGIKSLHGNCLSQIPYEFNFITCKKFIPITNLSNTTQSLTKEIEIEFSNEINEFELTKDSIQFEPELNGEITLSTYSGNYSNINKTQHYLKIKLPNKFQSNKLINCKMTFLSNFKDIYNQNIDENENHFTFKLKPKIFPCGIKAFKTGLFTMNPFSKKTNIYTVNVYNYSEIHVQFYKMDPKKDLKIYLSEKYPKIISIDKNPSDFFKCGKKIFDGILQVPNYKRDVECYLDIDLSNYCNSYAHGQIGIVCFPSIQSHEPNKTMRSILHAWIQITDIGIEYLDGYGKSLIWANDLKTNQPKINHKISILNLNQKNNEILTQETNNDGLGYLLNLPTNGEKYLIHISNNNHSDEAFIYNIKPKSSIPNTYQLLWHVYDDRKFYRPKEIFVLQGFIRSFFLQSGISFEKLTIPGPYFRNVGYALIDSNNNIIKSEINSIQLNEFGAFQLSFEIPENISLGETIIELMITSENKINASNISYKHKFKIEEFKTPEFETKISSLLHHNDDGDDKKKPVTLFDNSFEIPIIAKNKYFSSSPVMESKIIWNICSRPGIFIPLHSDYSKFNFGYVDKNYNFNKIFENQTDFNGDSSIKIEFNKKIEIFTPLHVDISTEVIDNNNISLVSDFNLLIHPSECYIGLWSPIYNNFHSYSQLNPLEIQFIIYNIKLNQCVKENFTVKIYLKIKLSRASFIKKELEIESNDKENHCFIDLSELINENDFSKISQIEILAHCNDLSLYSCLLITNHHQNQIQNNEINIGKTLIEIEPNNPIHLYTKTQCFIQSESEEIKNAQGLLAIRKNGISLPHIYPFELKNSKSNEINLEFSVDMAPNINIDRLLIGNYKNNFFSKISSTPILISTKKLELNVIIHPDEEIIPPGSSTNINIEVRDYNNEIPLYPISIALIVVDDAILSISNYSPIQINPMKSFYPKRSISDDFPHVSSRNQILTYENELPLHDNAKDLINIYPANSFQHTKKLKRLENRFVQAGFWDSAGSRE